MAPAETQSLAWALRAWGRRGVQDLALTVTCSAHATILCRAGLWILYLALEAGIGTLMPRVLRSLGLLGFTGAGVATMLRSGSIRRAALTP